MYVACASFFFVTRFGDNLYFLYIVYTIDLFILLMLLTTSVGVFVKEIYDNNVYLLLIKK